MFKILKVLDKQYTYDLIKFYFLLALLTIFEFLAVFIILPISQILFKNKIELNFFLTDYLNSLSLNILIFISLISLLFIYLIKNKLVVYFNWWKLNFINKFEENISYELIKKYFSKEFSFFQNYTVGKFNNYLTKEMSNFSNSLLLVLQLISETIIFVAVSGLLIYHQTTVSLLLVTTILVTAILAGFFLKKFSIKFGEEWVRSSDKINNFAVQSFNSINEIKVYFKTEFFAKLFTKYKKNNLIAKRNSTIIGELPKPIFEFILILSFITIIYHVGQRNEFHKLPEIMSLFLAGSYRLIPAVSRFSVIVQSLKRNKFLINNIINDLQSPSTDNDQKSNLKFDKTIDLKDINFAFQDAKLKEKNIILNNLNFSIKKNSLNGIVGKSGCGKTTLLKIILGFFKPNNGQVLIDRNWDIADNLNLWLKNISYVTQDPVIIEDTIKTNIALSHDDIDESRLNDCIELACLSEDMQRFNSGINTILGPGGVKLSGGQKQRISIARALYNSGNIIILDEPTSSLDKMTEKKIIDNLISLSNKTIIMVTHKADLLKKFDQIINLE